MVIELRHSDTDHEHLNQYLNHLAKHTPGTLSCLILIPIFLFYLNYMQAWKVPFLMEIPPVGQSPSVAGSASISLNTLL